MPRWSIQSYLAMKKNLSTLFRSCACLLLTLPASPLFAQTEVPVDFIRSIGKMYVVVGVIVLVFLGIVAAVWYLDRRLTKLEDQIDHHA